MLIIIYLVNELSFKISPNFCSFVNPIPAKSDAACIPGIRQQWL